MSPNGNAFFYQLRSGIVSQDAGPNDFRTRFVGSILTPPQTSGRLISSLRLDAGTILGKSTQSWFGGEAGASYEPRDNFRLSAGIYGFANFGDFQFVGDQFISNQGLSLRGDLYGNATKVSLMWRYDPTLGWFDRQLRISQVMGPIEPVIVYRGEPNLYQLGFSLRLDEIINLLTQRSSNRTVKSTKIRP